MKPLNTTIEEVLRKAIQEEIASRAYYLKLYEVASTPDVKSRLRQLADLQVLHRVKLERRYEEETGAPPPPAENVSIELPSDLPELDIPRILKIALEHEREAESNYRFLAERVPHTELGALFLELAELEWNHKVEIQREYDALDPERFLLDI